MDRIEMTVVMNGIPCTVRADLPNYLVGSAGKLPLESALIPLASKLAKEMAEILCDRMRSDHRLF